MQNIATDLAGTIWNAISDLVSRSEQPRTLYFARVTKADKTKNLIWTEDFGGLAIPLVSHTYSFSYYDTVPDLANLTTGAVSTHSQKRGDTVNSLYETQIVCPSKGDTVVIIDPFGAKRFPICIGVIHSKTGFWEGE